MNKRRSIKKRKYELNKLKKAMRELNKKNRKNSTRTRASIFIEYCTDVIDLLSNARFENSKKITLKHKVVINIPTIFAFSENPDVVISTLKEIYNYGMNTKVKEIHFDHSKCIKLGIAASTVMDVIVVGIKTYRKKIKQTISFSGYILENSPINNILLASGIIKHLNAYTGIRLNQDNIKLFKLHAGKNNSQKSDMVATNLKEYFENCLSTQGYRLDDVGANYLGKMFGEVINNCEIHGGMRSIWYTLGHYEILKDEKYGEFHLVIFNFGDSIYERINAKETTKEIQELLNKMDNIHKKHYNSKWNKEAMYTVFSLQEGISRLKDRNIPGNRKRGTGTIRLMESLNAIGLTQTGKEPELTITSGNISIKFSKQYKLNAIKFNDNIMGNNERKIIAFNKDNDIYQPADSNNVKIIEEHFPGTVISMEFYLDRKYLHKFERSKKYD